MLNLILLFHLGFPLLKLQKYGGSAVVENSTVGLQRDIQFVRQASEQSGVHVIAGTGARREISRLYLRLIKP